MFSDLKGLFTDVEKQKIAESIGLELQQKYDSQKDGERRICSVLSRKGY